MGLYLYLIPETHDLMLIVNYLFFVERQLATKFVEIVNKNVCENVSIRPRLITLIAAKTLEVVFWWSCFGAPPCDHAFDHNAVDIS